MQVKWCKLKNFRNYDNIVVNFFDGINLISGGNGQGKTNLVESIMLNALSKSPRTTHDEDLKKEGETHAEVEICVKRSFGDLFLKTIIDDELKKKFYLNSNELKKVSSLFGNLVAVYFSPDDLIIVSGSPAERRNFMDTDISQLSGSYYNLIQRYQKVLNQRNKFLKTVHNRQVVEEQIDIWDEQLANLSGLIIKTRKSFIEKLKVPANETMQFISKEKDSLEIIYDGAKGETVDEIKNDVLRALKYNLSKDMELGYTTIGPHRDDLIFKLNGKDSKVFASQGQMRSIVLALKIAELEVFEREIGEKPILVLDDVFSELDTTRQKKLYSKLKDFQVLMTGTMFKFKPDEDYQQITIKNATAKEKFKEKNK